jgi:hypothetical protein
MKEVNMALQVFRNSLGDINDPDYSYWGDENESISETTRSLYTAWVWIIFVSHEFFILVCLLNFLIAIVSQSYDSIMDNEKVETTQSKIYMNNEASIIFDAIDLILRTNREISNVVHVIADMSEYE